MLPRSSKICRSGLKLDTTMKSSGSPKTRQSTIRSSSPRPCRAGCDRSPLRWCSGTAVSATWARVPVVSAGGGCGAHRTTSLSRVR